MRTDTRSPDGCVPSHGPEDFSRKSYLSNSRSPGADKRLFVSVAVFAVSCVRRQTAGGASGAGLFGAGRDATLGCHTQRRALCLLGSPPTPRPETPPRPCVPPALRPPSPCVPRPGTPTSMCPHQARDPTSMLGAHPRGPPRASLLKPPRAQPGAALAVTASRYFVGSRVCVLKTSAVRTVASPHRAARSQARASEAVGHHRRRRVEEGVLATVTVGSVCDTRVAHGSPACSCWCRQRPERSSLPEAVGTSLSPVAGPGAPDVWGGAARGGRVSVVSTGSWGDAPQTDSVDTHVPRALAALRARAAPPRHLPQVREQAGGGGQVRVVPAAGGDGYPGAPRRPRTLPRPGLLGAFVPGCVFRTLKSRR